MLNIFVIEDCQGTIVFVEQKRQADFIAVFLSELNYPTTSIHGDREQPERERALKDFKTKKMKILVATSVAARGLGKFLTAFIVNGRLLYVCVGGRGEREYTLVPSWSS